MSAREEEVFISAVVYAVIIVKPNSLNNNSIIHKHHVLISSVMFPAKRCL